MATVREHFALDWIKADLLETLNEARVSLDDYAEQAGDETRMRACLTGLHQVHGTLVMLELKGVTQLADHLEQLAQALLAKRVDDVAAAGQALMQGILELPGYLDELQRGAIDSVSTSMALVNEIREILKLEPLIDPAGGSLRDGASDEVIARFNAIGGPEKVGRIRSAYQNVLLSILKGEDRSAAVATLSKIAAGLSKVTAGAPLERQWHAFGEFVTSLGRQDGVLESAAVKLLRRVDVEIKNLAKHGEEALRRPVNVALVQQLLDGAVEREHNTPAVSDLQHAVARDVSNNTLAISGRQALGSAAGALQEDLALVKDKLDLLVRGDSIDLEELRQLITPLKQIGSTLSLLGFESSREVVADQVDGIESLVVLGDGDPQGVQSIARALTQIDENLNSVILGSGQTEVELITSEAQLQVLREARRDVEHIKQCIVEFVTTHWNMSHLETIPGKLADIRGALGIIPLERAIVMLGRVGDYIRDRLMRGHRPEWQELDQFADVVSAIDYYLERLVEENGSGADEILAVAARGLAELERLDPAAPVVSHETEREAAEVIALQQPESAQEQEQEQEQAPEPLAELEGELTEPPQDLPDTPVITEFELEELTPDFGDAELQAGAADIDVGASEVHESDMADVADAAGEEQEFLDTENLPVFEEPTMELEQDIDFDLSSDVFADLEGTIEPVDAAQPGAAAEADVGGLAARAEAGDAAAPEQPPEVELPDPEIVEIFVEELDEILETLGEYVPQWAENFDAADALAEIRRAFHTLKGSGRIVQAVAIGELAWGIENMLNRVIDGTVAPNAQFIMVIDAARALVPSLRDAFERGKQADLEAIGLIIEQADLLSSGGEIEQSALPAQAPAATTSAADELPAAQTPETVEVFDADVLDAAAADAASVDLTAADALGVAGDADSVSAGLGAQSADEPSTVNLFVAEARELLSIVEAENARLPWSVSEPLARAFHTLAGGAALTQLHQVQLIVEPAYQVVEAFRDAEPNDALRQFFIAAASHLASCLDALVNQQDWEEPLEFVAQADDLMVDLGTAPRVLNQLLHAPATAALFEAEPELAAYLAAGQGGSDSSIANLQAVLHELAGLANDSRAAPLAELATALAQALAAAAAGHLPADCATVVRGAYDQLIDQLNEIAAGSEIAAQDDLVARLAALDFSMAPAENDVAATAIEDAAAAAAEEIEIEIEDVAATAPETLEMSPADAANVDAEAPPVEVEKSEIAELAEIDPDLVQVFFEEAEEINEELESSIISWSRERENRIYMENMLRGLHTFKGGARLCGLGRLGDMAHDFETIVIEVQTGERPIDDAMFDELNRRYDEIAKCLSEVSAEVDVATAALEQDNVVTLPAADVMQPERPPSVSDVNKIVEAVVAPVVAAASARGADGELPPSIVPDDKAAKPEAPQTGERGAEMIRVGSALLEELVNLAGESSILRARIEQGMSDFTGALDEMETTIERLREQLRRLEIETETQMLHRHERTDGPQYENFDPLEMDRYNQMQQLSRSLSESASDMTDLKETLLFKARESETLLLQQARINTELQEGLMRTRMVPFSRLMPRLRRIVRQVSSELEKDIEFHVQNAEGELDRNLLERMVPPLEHMLRNAVDHGIESAEMRRNFGKAATGRIDLRLTREGGDVVIEISDDGAGIDVEGVRSKAIERGLMAADADLSDEEALQFVLAPGFSTAKSVTQISGRGVGLDVVHSEVKQLGGSVSIISRAGKGTRFVIRVPFTVSVNRALMVSVTDDLYAIPLNTIEGIVLLSPDQLQALYSSEGKTFEYAGVPYRVRYLGQYLGREYRGPVSGQGSVPMVLVRSGDHAVAIHVDLVQGSREIVVKSLGPQFAGVGGISGATILGDGSVVVILDLLALIRAQHHEGARRSGPSYSSRRGPRCVMVVDDSVTVRKVTSRLLERQGMDVLVAKDGIEAVAMLQERRPDVILLDIEMPRMDGFEVARQVRHDTRLSSLPIIMISSRTGEKHKEHASQLGVNKFLGKPFQENELLATIDELVTRS